MLRKYTTAVQLYQSGTLAKQSNSRRRKVATPFVRYVDYEKKQGPIVVPVGFVFDFGSIPQWLRWWFDPTRYLAYLLHDYMYAHLIDYRKVPHIYQIKRKQADDALYEALVVEGMSRVKAWLVRVAVRIFGGFYQKSLRVKQGERW